MDYRIVSDSSCDMTSELKEYLKAESVPLTLTVDGVDYRDDGELDVARFVEKMKASTSRVMSAAPSPEEYEKHYSDGGETFVVTLSSRLSASYQNAVIGAQRHSNVHVVDSKSASAGQTLIAIKLRELFEQKLNPMAVFARIKTFVDEMKLYFVLDDPSNLVKNGRMNKIVGKIITALNIRPVFGSDGDGNIKLFSSARGEEQAVKQLVAKIGESGKDPSRESLVITHCNNEPLAKKLEAAINSRFDFMRIYIVPMGGLSSLYANDKGIIMAF